MKKLFLAAAMSALMLLPAHAGVERLKGSWKSNKEVTLEYLKKHTKMTPEQLDRASKFLGQTTFTFDEENFTLINGPRKFVSKYKIVKESKKKIIIESNDPRTGKPIQTILEMDKTGFWNPEEQIKGYKERFDKVKE